MPPVLRNLSASELTGPEVRELLRLATHFGDGALDRLVSEVLPRLTVLAAMDDDAGRTPIALAAYAPPGGQAVREPEAGPQEPRPSPSTTIEYIATSPHAPADRYRASAHRGDPSPPPARRPAGEH